MGSLFGGGKKAPSVPEIPVQDPNQLLQAQADYNRVDQFTPFGNLIYGGDKRNEARIQLSPEQQRIVNLALDQLGVQQPSLSSQEVADNMFSAYQNRINPEFDRRRTGLQNHLTQLGNPATGSDLAPRAVSELDVLGTQQNDALLQAFLQSQQAGAQARLSDIQGTNAQQNQLIQNAMFGGGQLMGFQPQPLDVLGPYQLQLAGQQANQQAAAANAQAAAQRKSSKNGLLGTLGSAALGAFFPPAGIAALPLSAGGNTIRSLAASGSAGFWGNP